MKKAIAITLVLVFALTLSFTAYASEYPHWATENMMACVDAGILPVSSAYSADSIEYACADISYSDFIYMLTKAAAYSNGHDFTLKDYKVITRYQAIETLSNYLNYAHCDDSILQGRQKYMTAQETYVIAKLQNIDKEHVLDFIVVYSCGLFNANGCDGERNLTYGEMATICVRLMEYEQLRASNDIGALDMFYNLHCTCVLTGEHD